MLDSVSMIKNATASAQNEKLKSLEARAEKGEQKSFEDTLISELLDTKAAPSSAGAASPARQHGDEAPRVAGRARPKDARLWDTCVEMESIFVKQMLSEMKKTIEKQEDFLHGGNAEDIFEDMLYDQYALEISKNGDMGVAKTMYEQLSMIR